jgi:hypothetical protein
MYQAYKMGSSFWKGFQEEGFGELFYTCEQEFQRSGKDKNVEAFRSILHSYMNRNGSTKTRFMEHNILFQMNADVYISHSRHDEVFAMALAGEIRESIGLVPILNSYIWKQADLFLQELEDNYLKRKHDEMHNQEMRDEIRKYIYMMTRTVLDMMIYKTECFFYVNSSNIIMQGHVMNQKTECPWMHHDLVMSRLLYNEPKRCKEYIGRYNKNKLRHPYDYAIKTSHLIRLDFPSYYSWTVESLDEDRDGILDTLYGITLYS